MGRVWGPVPGVGFEPTRPLGQGLLRAPCLAGSTTRAFNEDTGPELAYCWGSS